jgi:fermentation-respiration switch protein FrsA (DUF1100 family)
MVATPADAGLRYRTLALRAADGVELHAWLLPAQEPPARAAVLFLHGNAENVSTHFANVAWMPAAGFDVLALEYRGYGSSGGTPSLPGVQLDIDAGVRALRQHAGAGRRVALFGQSLGGALAIHYGARGGQRDALCAVIADSAFADYRQIVREKLAGFFLTWPFQWLPSLTVDNDYSPLAAVAAVQPLPLLLVHGERDAIVPPHHARRLFEAAAEPKALWLAPRAGHIQALRDPEVRERLRAFITGAGCSG